MSWGEGHQWSLECTLPHETFEFKIVVFEGHGIRWEGGSNRVVRTEGDEGDVPVEIVVWLTCHFDATSTTQLQLAVPRASVLDAYETGKATLEFLKRRRAKLGQDADQAPSPADRTRQAAELARLSAAVAEQSGTLSGLEDMLGQPAHAGASRSSGLRYHQHDGSGAAGDLLDADDSVLLLAIDSVSLPRALRRISFANVVQAWSAGPATLLAGAGSAQGEGAAEGASGAGSAPGPSPFLRGELDVRAEELMSAAGELLLAQQQGGQTPSPEATAAAVNINDNNGSPASASAPAATNNGSAFSGPQWALLAEEASQVAGALEALGAGAARSGAGAGSGGAAQVLQLQGLASVGMAMAMAERGVTAATGVPIADVGTLDPSGTEAEGGVAPALVACLDGGAVEAAASVSGSVLGDSGGARPAEAVAAKAAAAAGLGAGPQQHAAAAAAPAAGPGLGLGGSSTDAALGADAGVSRGWTGSADRIAGSSAGAGAAAPLPPLPGSGSPHGAEGRDELHAAPWQRIAASFRARLAPPSLHAGPRSWTAAPQRPQPAGLPPSPPEPAPESLHPQPHPSPAGDSEAGTTAGAPATPPLQEQQPEESQSRPAPPKVFNLRNFLDSLFL